MRHKIIWAALASLLTAGLVSGISMQSASAETDGGGIVPVTNWRLFTTTSTTPMYSGQTQTLQVTGTGGIPSTGVSAVVVEVAASSAKSVYVTVAPSGSGQTYSQLSVQANDGWDSNTAIVRVSSTGKVDLSVSGGATHIKLSVQGYVTSEATTDDGGFVAITQARIARSDTGQGFASTAAVVGGWNYVVDVAGVGGVPEDASAVFANVRVFSATGSGGLRVGPSTLTTTSESALLYQESGAYDSAALVRLGSDGKIRLFANAGTNLHVMIDVQGYVTPGDDGAGFTPIVPKSILTADTATTHILGGETREVQVTGVAGIPDVDDVGAAMFDFIATTWTSTGSLALYNADDEPSNVWQLRVEGSSTNTPQRTTVIAAVSADGKVKITNHGTTPVGVRIAVQGWFSPTASQVEDRSEAGASPEFVALPATEVIHDTTSEDNVPLEASEHRVFRINGLNGVPETGTDNVRLRVVTRNGTGTGIVQIRSRQSEAVVATVQVSATGTPTSSGWFDIPTPDGSVDLYSTSTGDVDVAISASGYDDNGEPETDRQYGIELIREDGASIDQNLSTGQITLRDPDGQVVEGDDIEQSWTEDGTDGADLVEEPADESETPPEPDGEEVQIDPGFLSDQAIEAEVPAGTDQPDQPVTTASSVPSGFVYLCGFRQSSYVWKHCKVSSHIYFKRGSTKIIVGRVDWTWKVTLYGGSYRQLRSEVAATPWRDSVGRMTRYSARYEYWCGVNVANYPDYTCDELDSNAARHYGPYQFATGTTSAKTIARQHTFAYRGTNKRQYPMLKMAVIFPDYGAYVITRVRGKDFLHTSSLGWIFTSGDDAH